MELENTIETKDDVIQPDKVVVTDSEKTEANPQAEATEEQELYVDDSSDDQKVSHTNEMTQAQSYAAFQKKKKQSAQRKVDLDESKKREQKLQSELDELKATVGNLTKGKEPTLEGCDFDEESYQSQMRDYYSKPEVKPAKAEAKTEVASNPANEEAEFYLYQREQELSKAIPDYEKAKANVIGSFAKHGIPDSNVAMNYLSRIAKQKKVDIAKVIVAMDKVPTILGDLIKAGTNDFEVADILEAAANKVKTRDKKRIESKPEPEVNNSGPIDNSAGTIKKLYQAWKNDPSLANHKRYIAAKNK